MKSIILFIVLGLFSLAHAESGAQAWSKITQPTRAKTSESIGSYTSGCIRGAATLAPNGEGYQVMRPSRKRFYGHTELVQFIEKLGHTSHREGLGTILVGDLGQPRGGPTLSGHRSHQTGLDVDIWYLLSPDADKRQLSKQERESWGAPSVVTAREDGVIPSQWSLANEKILEAAAKMAEVDRIFVNARVKEALCKSSPHRDWLEKIRPWYAHADHFHVRLKCPAGNPDCEKQDPVPKGDGCGSDLSWWFSAEAHMPSKKPPAKKVALPALCDSVLHE